MLVARLQAGRYQLVFLVKKLDTVQFRIRLTILHYNASDLRRFCADSLDLSFLEDHVARGQVGLVATGELEIESVVDFV